MTIMLGIEEGVDIETVAASIKGALGDISGLNITKGKRLPVIIVDCPNGNPQELISRIKSIPGVRMDSVETPAGLNFAD